MLLLLHRRVIFLFVLFFCFEMDEDYNIYEYDSDNDLSGGLFGGYILEFMV